MVTRSQFVFLILCLLLMEGVCL